MNVSGVDEAPCLHERKPRHTKYTDVDWELQQDSSASVDSVRRRGQTRFCSVGRLGSRGLLL